MLRLIDGILPENCETIIEALQISVSEFTRQPLLAGRDSRNSCKRRIRGCSISSSGVCC